MTAARSGHLAGLAILLALTVWFVASCEVGLRAGYAPGEQARQLVSVLFLVQILAVALLAPILAVSGGRVSALTGVASPVLLPLPLLAVAWMAGRADLASLAGRTAVLLAVGLAACVVLSRLLARIPVAYREPLASGLGLAAAAIAWMTHSVWIPGPMWP